MPAPPNLFQFIVLLLGALLVLMAATGKMAIPSHPGLLVVLGFAFVFWAARAWARPSANEGQVMTGVRAASLGAVGILLIAIPLLSLGSANLLLGIAGGVLVARGIAGGLLSLRKT